MAGPNIPDLKSGSKRTKPLKILIAGLPRSGTTGLFFKILNSLAPSAYGLLEPASHDEIYRNLSREQLEKLHIVTKVIFNKDDHARYNIAQRPRQDFKSFEHYDKKIFLVRDPRDNLISLMLYEITNGVKLVEQDNFMQVIALLQKKEANPSDVSVLDFLHFMNKLNASDFIDLFQMRRKFSVEYLDAHRDYFVFKYEDFVTGRLEPLEQYLGFPVCGDAQVHEMFRDVERTKSSGDWKNWFLENDVEYFRLLLGDYMRRYGYPEDWDLSV